MGDFKGSAKDRTFDAIVVGSGMSGGWAAKEFTEKGLKTLVLERGRDVKHIKDYPTANKFPYEFEHRGEMPLDIQKANPIINRCYAFSEDAAHFFVKDAEHPYVQDKPFDWIRGYQVGGKSLMWARATQRSPARFSSPSAPSRSTSTRSSSSSASPTARTSANASRRPCSSWPRQTTARPPPECRHPAFPQACLLAATPDGE